MWPLSRRRGRLGEYIQPPAIQKMEWKVFEKNEAMLNFNPTVPQREALNWLCSLRDCTRNDLLLYLVFRHLYGTIALEGLREYVVNKTELAQREELHRIDALLHARGTSSNPRESNQKESDSERLHGEATIPGSGEAMFSRARDVVRELDEAHIGQVEIEDGPMILRLPTKMREDLDSVATAHGLKIGTYFRKLLVVELDGETRHTFWQKAQEKID